MLNGIIPVLRDATLGLFDPSNFRAITNNIFSSKLTAQSGIDISAGDENNKGLYGHSTGDIGIGTTYTNLFSNLPRGVYMISFASRGAFHGQCVAFAGFYDVADNGISKALNTGNTIDFNVLYNSINSYTIRARCTAGAITANARIIQLSTTEDVT